jgi:hypothetical protein
MLDRFLEVTAIWRGTDVIINQYFEWLQTSQVGFLLQYLGSLPDIPQGASRSLRLLSRSLDGDFGITTDLSQRSMYELQLQRLYNVCRCAEDEASRAHIPSWPTNLPSEIVECLQKRDDFAVAMVAFWAACFHALRDWRWARGWAQALVSEAVESLGQKWSDVLHWPRQVVSSS